LDTNSDPPSLDSATPSFGETSSTRPLLLVNVLRLRSATARRGWRVFAEDISGLAVGFALVGALVVATALLLSL
jgi:hypothetical protein